MHQLVTLSQRPARRNEGRHQPTGLQNAVHLAHEGAFVAEVFHQTAGVDEIEVAFGQSGILAIGAVEGLGAYHFYISARAIRQGLAQSIWPGRCEVLSKKPYLVLDGAQNLASAQILKKALQDNFNYKKLILVLGISLDKDIFGICKVLEGLADKVILTQAKTKRAAPVAKIAKCFKTQPYLTHNIKAAQILARTLAKEDDLILVTGSLFVVGEYRNVERLS